MAVQDISRLYSALASSKVQTDNNALWQCIKGIIDALIQVKNQETNDLTQAVADLQKAINALANEDFATVADDSADLPNSRQLLAGTGISFDDTITNQRTINSSSSGGGGSSSSGGSVIIPTPEEVNNLLVIPPRALLEKSMAFIMTGGTSTPTTGAQSFANRPATGGVFTHWTAIGFPSGSAVVDIGKASFSTGAFPSVTSICASDKPTLSSAQVAEGTCTGWTTGFDRGDLFQPNLNSVTTCTAVMAILWYLPR